MKFTTFLKVFGISLLSFVGAIGVGVGIMYIAGTFNDAPVEPANISFEFSEYNVDDDFSAMITTSTEEVNQKELVLSFVTNENVVEKDGRISNGVISIPKYAKIGEKFTVNVLKTKNDSECGNQDWVTGGHAVVKAESKTNSLCEATRATVNVDVPVYSVSVDTKASNASTDTASAFVVNSSFYASLNFHPQRSAYSYSQDGTNGFEKILKNAYFMLQNSTDDSISQVGTTNQFNANRVGNDRGIIGYAFSTSVIEENTLKLFADKSEQAKYSLVMAELERLVNDTTVSQKKAVKGNTAIDVVNVNVNEIQATENVQDVYVDKVATLYANNSQVSQDNSANLKIKLLSNIDSSVSLQSKISNVGIRFLYKINNTFYDAINGDNSLYNIVKMTQDGYSKVRTYDDNGNIIKYYMPVLTSDIANYYWQYAVGTKVESGTLYVEIKYFDDEINVPTIKVVMGTKSVLSSPISWSDTTGQTLKIFDGESVSYEEYNLADNAQVPSQNLYTSKKYFAFGDDDKTDISKYIYCVGTNYVEYSLGAQTYKLYEIADGIVKAKTVEAHGKSFNVIFTTVETDYLGQVKLDKNGKYIINQFSQDELGAVSSMRFTITKTLKAITTSLQTTGNEDEVVKEQVSGVQNTYYIAFVQNQSNPFDVIVGCGTKAVDTEKEIFRQAVANEEISIVAKIDDIETDLIDTISYTEQSTTNDIYYRFSLKIGALPVGVSASNVSIYVRYKKSVKLEPTDIKITSCTIGNSATPFVCSYIEIYDGAAIPAFKFNSSEDNGGYVVGDAKPGNSDTNRIVVSSTINETNGIANKVDTTYILNSQSIIANLFTAEGEGKYSNVIGIVLLDIHGQTPLDRTYSLKSSDQTVMITSGGTITFVSQGKAELQLLDSKGKLVDTIYFESATSGRVISVDKLTEVVISNEANKQISNEFTYNAETEEEYAFPQLTVPIVGYYGSTIKLKDSTANAINLIRYTYSYATGVVNPETKEIQYKSCDLVNLVKFKLQIDTTELENLTGENGLFTFTMDGDYVETIKIKKDFGQRKSIQLLATIEGLGISQVIVLDIKPNVTISAVPVYENIGAISFNGVQQYNGVYAETVFNVKLNFSYVVSSSATGDFLLDSSKYVFYVGEPGNELQVINSIPASGISENTYAYLINNVDEFNRPESSIANNLISYDLYVVFKSTGNAGYRKINLTIKKASEFSTDYDANSTIYLYVNPNVKTVVGNDQLYLKTTDITLINGDKIYNQYVLFNTTNTGAIKIARKINADFAYDDSALVDGYKNVIDTAKVNIELSNVSDDNTNNIFYVENVGGEIILNIKSTLNSKVVVDFKVYYDGYIVEQSSDDNTIKLSFYPNIIAQTDSDLWVKYDGQNYIAFVNDTVYSFDKISEAFISDSTIESFEIGPNTTKYLTNDWTGKVDGDLFKIENVEDELVFKTEEEESLYIIVKLTNGSSLRFNVVLLPSAFPFVNYGSFAKIEDLKDLLDVNYLIENNYYYSLTNAGTDQQIAFNLDELNTKTYGMQFFSKAKYSVNNVNQNDAFIYATCIIKQDGTGVMLKTTEVGGNGVFIIVYANLNPIKSNALIVPYIIKIVAELELKTYYPYLTGESTNDQEIVGNELRVDLDNVTYDMEYLSFDQSGMASINLTEELSSLVPNKSNLNNSRFCVQKSVNDNGVVSQIEVNSVQMLKFEIVDIYYYSFGFKQVDKANFSNYALFSTGASKNVLNILSNGSQKLRIKLRVYTENGLEGWYYISIGEIPTFKLTNQGAINPELIGDITTTAGTSMDLSSFKLTKIGDKLNVDATSILNFYSPKQVLELKDNEQGVIISKDENLLTTAKTINDWTTKLVFYSKYGELQQITLKIVSNYVVEILKDEVYSASKINVSDLFNFKSGDGVINYQSIAIQCNSDIVSSVENNFINIKLTDLPTTIAMDITINFTDGSPLVYEFTFNLKVLPPIEIAKTNGTTIALNNRLDLGSAKSASNVVVDISNGALTDEKDANGLYVVKNEKFASLNDFITANITNIKFNIACIEGSNKEILSISNITNGKFTITFKDVAVDEIYTFKTSLTNIGTDTEILISYFTIKVLHIYSLQTNYPIPNAEESIQAETFYFQNGANDEINTITFAEKAIFSTKNRISVVDSSGDEIQDIGNIKIVMPSGDFKMEFASAKYKFTSVKQDANSVDNLYEFKVKYNDVYFGSYYVYLVDNSEEIFNVTQNNYNNSVSPINSTSNIESIYIGSGDDIMNKVKLDLTINAVAKTSQFIKINKIFGKTVKSQPRIEINASGVTTASGIYMFSAATEEIDASKGIEYSVYASNISNEEIPKTFALKYKVSGRIGLKYVSYSLNKDTNSIERKEIDCSYDNVYKYVDSGINVSSSSTNIDETLSKAINVNKSLTGSLGSINVGTYYCIFSFDIDFNPNIQINENNQILISTNQSISVLKQVSGDNHIEKPEHYLGALNLVKKSNGDPYLVSDFGADSGKISLGLTLKYNNYGYLSKTAYILEDSTEYDYLLIALGAPNEDREVIAELTINSQNKTKVYTFKFLVSNDYTTPILTNGDNTINSQINRYEVYGGFSYTFAIAGSEDSTNARVFLLHKNTTSESTNGNAAVSFYVELNNGENYMTQQKQTDANMDLVFTFRQITFGDIKIDLRFVDNYGYEFYYYLTLKADTNPEYVGTNKVIFEQNKIDITSDSTYKKTGDVSIVISNMTTQQFGDSKPNVQIKLSFVYTDKDGNVKTITQEKLVVENGHYVYTSALVSATINYLSDLFVEDIVSVTGNLIITLIKGDESVDLSIPTTMKKRYLIESVDSKLYVRDSVQFSLSDIVDVVDNQTNLKVGDRNLKKVHTLYISVEDFKGEDKKLLNDDVSDFSLCIVMFDLNKKFETILPINLDLFDDNNVAYVCLEDLFNITSIDNYAFYVGYIDANGITHRFKMNKNDTEGYLVDSASKNTKIYTELEYNSLEESLRPKNGASIQSQISNIALSTPITITEATTDNVGEPKKLYEIGGIKASIIRDTKYSITIRDMVNDYDNNKLINITTKFNNNNVISVPTSSKDASGAEIKNFERYKSYLLSKEKTINYSGETIDFVSKIDKSNGNNTIIRGINITELNKLKGISFFVAGFISTTMSIAIKDVYDETNNPFRTATETVDGVSYSIKYVIKPLELNVHYFDNQKQIVLKDIYVTLKYIGLNKTLAYGTSMVKKISFDVEQAGYDVATGSFVNPISLTMKQWAGGTSDSNSLRPFKLIAGITTATSYVESDDNLYLGAHGQTGDISIALNTSQSASTANSSVEILTESNGLKFNNSFNVLNDYVVLDILVQFNGHAEVIDSVRLQLQAPNISTMQLGYANPSSSTLPLIYSKDNQLLQISEIYNALKISDSSGMVWTGNQIVNLGNLNLKVQFLDEDGNQVGQTANIDNNNASGISFDSSAKCLNILRVNKQNEEVILQSLQFGLTTKMFKSIDLAKTKVYVDEYANAENSIASLVQVVDVYGRTSIVYNSAQLTEYGVTFKSGDEVKDSLLESHKVFTVRYNGFIKYVNVHKYTESDNKEKVCLYTNTVDDVIYEYVCLDSFIHTFKVSSSANEDVIVNLSTMNVINLSTIPIKDSKKTIKLPIPTSKNYPVYCDYGVISENSISFSDSEISSLPNNFLISVKCTDDNNQTTYQSYIVFKEGIRTGSKFNIVSYLALIYGIDTNKIVIKDDQKMLYAKVINGKLVIDKFESGSVTFYYNIADSGLSKTELKLLGLA